MIVTCLMPTYGRASADPACMQEAVYWYLQQRSSPTYETELLIVNDAKEQTLRCDVPGVRILNIVRRFDSLGEKYNFGVEQARGEIILPWEDDDVSLPWRIEQAVWELTSTGAEYWNPQAAFFEQGGVIHVNHPQGINHNASAYRREFALRHPYTACNSQDAAFDSTARRSGKCSLRSLRGNISEWSYVYRWGHTSGHLSAAPDVDGAYKAWAAPQPGTFDIVPRMHRDYRQDVREACRRATAEQAAARLTAAMQVPAAAAGGLVGYDIDGVATRGVRPKPGDKAVYVSGRKTDAFARTVKELGTGHPIYLRPAGFGHDASEQAAGEWKAMMVRAHGITRFYDDSPTCIAAIRERCPGVETILVVDGVPQNPIAAVPTAP